MFAHRQEGSGNHPAARTERDSSAGLEIVAGTSFLDPNRQVYLVERILAKSRGCVAALCLRGGQSVVVELRSLETLDENFAVERAQRLRMKVHPKIPALVDTFFTRAGATSPLCAAFVFEEPTGVPIRVLFQRLCAVADHTKRLLILEVVHQLLELSAAAELAGAALPTSAKVTLDSVFVSGAGVFVAPYGALPPREVNHGALSVSSIAGSALRLAEEFGGARERPHPSSASAFERLEQIARGGTAAPAARDLLGWVHAYVPRYERQRFGELAVKIARGEQVETDPTVQISLTSGPIELSPVPDERPTRRSLMPLSLQDESPTEPRVKSTDSPRVFAFPKPSPEPAPIARHRTSRTGQRAGALLALLAVGGAILAARHHGELGEAPQERAPAVAVPLERTGALYSSAPGKDATIPCETCIDLRDAAPGRRVFVDGVLRGETPTVVSVTCGRHQLRVGSAAIPRSVDVPCKGDE